MNGYIWFCRYFPSTWRALLEALWLWLAGCVLGLYHMLLTSSWIGVQQVGSNSIFFWRAKTKKLRNIHILMLCLARNFLHVLYHMWFDCVVRSKTRTRDQGTNTRRNSSFYEFIHFCKEMNSIHDKPVKTFQMQTGLLNEENCIHEASL